MVVQEELLAAVYSLDIASVFSLLAPLFLFVIGIAAYSIFIFHFYKFIARKDIFHLDLSVYNKAKLGLLRKLVSSLFYLLKYAILFPVFTFLWFLVMTVMLTLLSSEPVIENVLLVSIAVVSAVRVTAYYDESLSHDLAKMLPFALLGVFLVDSSLLAFDKSLPVILALPAKAELVAYYLAFVILLEFLLRFASTLLSAVFPKEEEEKPAKE